MLERSVPKATGWCGQDDLVGNFHIVSTRFITSYFAY